MVGRKQKFKPNNVSHYVDLCIEFIRKIYYGPTEPDIYLQV